MFEDSIYKLQRDIEMINSDIKKMVNKNHRIMLENYKLQILSRICNLLKLNDNEINSLKDKLH